MFLDLGLSVIYAIVITQLFGIELTPLILLISALFSLLPDIDVPVELIQRGKLGGKESGFHREITHYPVLYVPVLLAIFILFGWFWVILALVNLLSHFIHDSLWTGWGVKWLWPVSDENIKFFADPDNGDWSLNLVAHWSPEELKNTMQTHGDDDWFKNMYLRPSPILIVEVGVLIIGLTLLVTFIL